MSTQITIEDLRYVVAQQYKPKAGSGGNEYANTFWKYMNNLRSLTGKDYYDWFYNTSDMIYDETSRTTGIPSRRPMGVEDMLYYDISNKFRVL